MHFTRNRWTSSFLKSFKEIFLSEAAYFLWVNRSSSSWSLINTRAFLMGSLKMAMKSASVKQVLPSNYGSWSMKKSRSCSYISSRKLSLTKQLYLKSSKFVQSRPPEKTPKIYAVSSGFLLMANAISLTTFPILSFLRFRTKVVSFFSEIFFTSSGSSNLTLT